MRSFPSVVSCRRYAQNAKNGSQRKHPTGALYSLQELCLLFTVRKTTVREGEARHLQDCDEETKNGEKLGIASAEQQDFILQLLSSGVENVKSQVRIIRRAYRLVESGRALRHVVFDGAHRWHGEQAIPWLQRWLQG